ncbi:hypothetical protein [Plastoroseomonas hellenica]|uniref:hypothetical protein n=1 Tax=Plastoroseomonas hellenica TaxID=2687306 RepID=UPI001BA69554|nr:hypothetical protein [Plastoroseomonas hellenica]MBR0641264.1 hypothetical protein [Plastoroseomonas hellenica]
MEIRNGLRGGHLFVIVAKLGIGVPLLCAAAFGSIREGQGGQLLVAWIGGLLLTGLGLIHLRTGLDKTVKLVLSSEGFQDQRSGGVLIPWHQIRQVRNHGTATNIIDLELVNDLYVGSDVMSGAGNIGSDLRRVRVPLDELDTTAGEMVAHIRRLAPHAAV